jgi:hypothetical protein
MHLPRLLTLLALLGFATTACDGSEPAEPAPTVAATTPAPAAPAPAVPATTAAAPSTQPAPVAAAGAASPAPAADPWSAYASSRYDYCDAKMIAIVWGQSVSDAKLTLGNKVAAGLTSLADADIANGRQKALAQFDSDRAIRCSYSDAGYSYDDAAMLASHWGMDTWEAKMLIEKKLLWGNADIVKSELISARTASGTQDPWASYASSRYDYCDAKMIAIVWGQSVGEAKLILGNKVAAGLMNLADADIAHGRQKALAQFDSDRAIRCSYSDAGYSYEDAAMLASHWEMDTWETKMLIEKKLLWGNEDIVKSELVAAKGKG